MNTSDDEDPGHSRSARVTVALQTVGCKLNQAESESLVRGFLDAGCNVGSPEENPDVYILNTCTVTHIADRKCRQYLRSFHRRNPDALVLVTGCYAERAAAELSQIEGVDLIIGNANKDRLVEIIEAQIGQRNSPNGSNSHGISPSSFHTRALVKIQDGCSQHCTYCIVPRVRGSERSVPLEAVMSEVRARVNEGYKEVVLTGTRIGAYEGDGGLERLVQRILAETAIPRVRLSSLQPQDLSPSLIQFWKTNERLCRHLHLPLQSGSDSVLRRMGRGYSTREYEEVVVSLRAAIPDIAITTDVIVGFPEESEEEFEQSYRFCGRMRFAGLHIFPYSTRPGTAADRMLNRVPGKTKKTRSHRMLELARQSTHDFRQRFVGETVAVLWEGQKENNIWVGHTDNYLKVFADSEEPLNNCLMMTKLVGEHEHGFKGILDNSTARWPKECGSDD